MLEKKKISNDEEMLKEKKKFLRKFYWDTKELDKLKVKLEKVTIKINEIKTSNISSMPRGGVTKDIGDLLGQQENYKQKIIKKIYKLEKNRDNIEASIDTLDDSKLRVILNYAYLENYTYKEIAAEFDKSERHIRRLHDDAIRMIRIIKK